MYCPLASPSKSAWAWPARCPNLWLDLLARVASRSKARTNSSWDRGSQRALRPLDLLPVLPLSTAESGGGWESTCSLESVPMAKAARLTLVDGLVGAVVSVGTGPMVVFGSMKQQDQVAGIEPVPDPSRDGIVYYDSKDHPFAT